MAMQTFVGADQQFNPIWIERVLLELGDTFNIRVSWNRDMVVLTSVCAIAGGLVGSYAGGRLGAALGAGIGGATGYGVSTMVSLREIWSEVKEKLQELLYIVFNFLRRLDPVDYINAFKILMACGRSKRELIYAILDFIAVNLSTEVISSITAG